MQTRAYRKTTQYLMPACVEDPPPGQYNPYPAYPLESGAISLGYGDLAGRIAGTGTAIIDGYPGVLWNDLRAGLEQAMAGRGLRTAWHDVETAMLPPEQVERLIAPYLGGNDPLFGYCYGGSLADFFDPQRLAGLRPDPSADVNILYGCGAALAGWNGLLVYVDAPKNEIQFRARAKSIKNLGAAEALEPKAAYKRSYFVDWPAANRHKAALLPRIDWVVDEQRPEQPAVMAGEALRAGLASMARSYFRPRPWFEPGPWGGQWIRRKIPQLAQDVPNYAWSFELIAPENGLVFASGGRLLEVSFDMLMFQEYQAVLGACAENFRYAFPIRYDFLDTFEGGNLSIQCHPRPDYIRRHFGERFTQDECYYILDCAPDARVYLGFQAGIDPQEFKTELLDSARTGRPVDIDRYVYSLPVKKHDLLLIPNGTIHGSGRGNLVLEISATPYIFTFKMYDWLRMDLDGKPRSLNIERAFANLYFDRQGERIPREFVSRQRLVAAGDGWRIVHCPTHPLHFYDVERLEFERPVESSTNHSCQVMSLVEGNGVLLETESGHRARFHYAETFVVPAAAGRYRLSSADGSPVKVVRTFVKPAEQWAPGVVPGD